MIITYLGGEFVKVQFGDTVVAFNPVSKDSSLKTSKFGADVVLSSINHEDMNGVDQISFGEKRINTVYTLSLEGMNICFLGALNTPELPKETDEAIDEVDILFVPIGGDGVLDSAKAYKLAVSIEPKII